MTTNLRVAELRRKFRIPLQTLAFCTGVPRSTLFNYEKGTQVLPGPIEHRVIIRVERIGAITSALPFPVSLSDGTWLLAILNKWDECNESAIDADRLFELCKEIRSKGWAGDEANEPEEFLPGPY